MSDIRRQAKRILSYHCKNIYKITGIYNKNKAKKICLIELNQFFTNPKALDLNNKNVFINYNNFIELKKQIQKL
jgi:hypothetical protein